MSDYAFYTVFDTPRPVRLSEDTRRLAYESLEEHRYGLEAMRTPAISLDGIEGFDKLPPLARQDIAIARIAAEAPIRLVPGERISGAATLGLSINHVIPATLGGNAIQGSISHLTVDFGTVLSRGLTGIRADAERSLATHAGTERESFLRSCLAALDAFSLWRERYTDALTQAVDSPEFSPEEKARFAVTTQNLLWVPEHPATTFHEAVQSLWFTFAFIRLMGNWPGIGRLDVLLGDYLEQDLATGVLTLDEAREILAHFFIKGCEWVRGGDCGSGDAQHYQNIVLGGIGEDGRDVTSALTYLVLDILEELPIGDFPTTVRVSATTCDHLLYRVAEVMRHGGGALAIYNENLVLRALTDFGYSPMEARRFANDGCWEVQIPGKTYFTYSPFDALQILQHKTLRDYAEDVDFPTFASLWARYLEDLTAFLRELIGAIRNHYFLPDAPTVNGLRTWVWRSQMPCTVVSLFEGGCIERGRSYLEGGPIYQVNSPHLGGLADTVNALYAIKTLVFDEGHISFSDFMTVLRNNWEGEEVLRQYILHRYRYYGNDNEACDAIAANLLDSFAAITAEIESELSAGAESCPMRHPVGVSTFGRQLEWSPHRSAAPHGRRQGEILAANASPTPGTDREGVTAMIRSYCAADLSRQVTGAALDCKLLPSSVRGEGGLDALVAILRGFVAEGGFFLQPDVTDARILREAQAHPEDYQTLSVRVSGWNARFVTLDRCWQDMVIGQVGGEGYA